MIGIMAKSFSFFSMTDTTSSAVANIEEDLKASSTSVCVTCKKEFLIIPQEKVFYKKKDLPFPDNCPECRQKRRLGLRNERKLYKRTCDKCQKSIISTYAQDSKYIVYCQECFWKYIG